jgi:hypothetical protein
MIAKQVKRRQHTVPKVLLRGFSQGNRLQMRRRSGGDHLTSLSDATVRSHFYSYPDSSGAPVTVVEDWLATDVEGPAAAVLERIRTLKTINAADTPVLARLIAACLLRTTTVRSYLRQIDTHIGPMLVIQQALARAHVRTDDLSAAGMAQIQAAATAVWSQHDGSVTSRHSVLRTFLREFDAWSSRLATWGWSVLSTTEPCFITSDAPVATLRPDGGGWHGIVPAGSPVFLPISPKHLIVGDAHAVSPGGVTEELACLVNTQLAREADDAIFAHPAMPWPPYVQLAKQRPALPTPTITWTTADPGEPSTSPSAYPPVHDAAVRALLDALGASDVVE